jgi:hypothetical protein
MQCTRKSALGVTFEQPSMEYFALGLAVFGAAVGIAFRWKVLLPVICLLPAASIIFSISRGHNFLEATIGILLVQAILQGGYFMGLLMRAIAIACIRSLRNK